MGLHSKSSKEVRKRKYAEQFAKTAKNKIRKAQNLLKRLQKAKERKARNAGQ